MEANELLDKALDFIVETQEDNDYICEQMIEKYADDYCVNNCQNLKKNALSCFYRKYIIKHKIMEAPERLYLSKNIYSTFLYQVPDPDDETEVEYIRADAFIEKVCKWFDEHFEDIGLEWLRGYNADEVIEDFKEYIRGK